MLHYAPNMDIVRSLAAWPSHSACSLVRLREEQDSAGPCCVTQRGSCGPFPPWSRVSGFPDQSILLISFSLAVLQCVVWNPYRVFAALQIMQHQKSNFSPKVSYIHCCIRLCYHKTNSSLTVSRSFRPTKDKELVSKIFFGECNLSH